MPRKKRPLDRGRGEFRDASLIVIASEDTYAVDDYFAQFKTRRVHIEVLPTLDSHSAPQHVMARLTDFEKDVPIEVGDTLWICIDRDRWDTARLAEVIRESLQRGYQVAISNPCFELWVLLHFSEVESTPRQTCSQVCATLKAVMGGYGRQCCRTMSLSRQKVEEAMERARAIPECCG